MRPRIGDPFLDNPVERTYECAEGDDFSACDESWSIIMTRSENVLIASACAYSWFSTYTEDCIDDQTCQKALVRLEDNYAGVRTPSGRKSLSST